MYEGTFLRMRREEVRQMQDAEVWDLSLLATGDGVDSPLARQRMPRMTPWQHIMDPPPLVAFGPRSRPLESDERVSENRGQRE